MKRTHLFGFLMFILGALMVVCFDQQSAHAGNRADTPGISTLTVKNCRMFDITKLEYINQRFRVFKREEIVAVTLVKQEEGDNTFTITACDKD